MQNMQPYYTMIKKWKQTNMKECFDFGSVWIIVTITSLHSLSAHSQSCQISMKLRKQCSHSVLIAKH